MAQNNLEIKLTEQQMERFWKKVAKAGPDDCWLWMAAKTKSCYGTFKIGKKMFLAHRIAFALTNPFDSEKLALHKCDVKLCCNPRHLYAGTYSDNTRDAYARARFPAAPVRLRGEQNPIAKLTQAKADEIRRLYAETDLSHRRIARRYGVSHTTVEYILNHKSYVKI